MCIGSAHVKGSRDADQEEHLTNCAGLELGLYSIVVSGELLVDVGLHHVVLRGDRQVG